MNAENAKDYCCFPFCGATFMLTKEIKEYVVGGVLVGELRTYCNTHARAY